MSDKREKLISLIVDAIDDANYECGAISCSDCRQYKYRKNNTCIEHMVADILVANGVVAETCDAVIGGKWLFNEPDKNGNRKPKCSKCGEYHLGLWSDYARCNYCPNCGVMIIGIDKI